MTQQRSEKWPKRHAQAQNKWKEIIRKTKARESFFSHERKNFYFGFEKLAIWESCGYCKEFNSCKNCLLNERKTEFEREKIPICAGYLDEKSAVVLYIFEMAKIEPNFERATALAEIISNEIAKDKP